MKIIAFYGPQQSGKSTAAKAIVSGNTYFLQASFASPIYDAVSAILNLDTRLVPSKEAPILGGKSLRQLLQTLGTEWGRRMVSEDIWVECMASNLDNLKKLNNRLIAIDDLRFRNEYEILRSRGAVIVRVDRPGLPVRVEQHGSEQEWQGFEPDHVMVNDFDSPEEWGNAAREWVSKEILEKL